jgi:mono/diheme cytochrome c family protein
MLTGGDTQMGIEMTRVQLSLRTLRTLAVLAVAESFLIVASYAGAQDKAAGSRPPDAKPAEAKSPALPPPYQVVDGFYVDPVTMNGFRAWRAAACDRCHGAYQQGLVGPSLLVSFKTLSKEDFIKTVAEGRLDKGMPSFKTSKMVMENLDGLYAYLKGRSNGDITQYRVRELKERESKG